MTAASVLLYCSKSNEDRRDHHHHHHHHSSPASSRCIRDDFHQLRKKPRRFYRCRTVSPLLFFCFLFFSLTLQTSYARLSGEVELSSVAAAAGAEVGSLSESEWSAAYASPLSFNRKHHPRLLYVSLCFSLSLSVWADFISHPLPQE